MQRFDAAIRFDLHFHGLFLDGVYTGFDSNSRLTLHPASQPTDDEVTALARHIANLINGHLRRRGHLDEDLALTESGTDLDEESTHQAAATATDVAGVQGLIPFGPHAGSRTLLFGEELTKPTPPRPKKRLCADAHGYSLHGAVRLGVSARTRLEKLCRYLARPCLSQERLSVAKNGHIVYRFRKAWRNGKTAVVMDPMTFLSRLAAQVPRPRAHVLTYHGVLAAASARRDEIVPGYRDEDGNLVRRHRSSTRRCGSTPYQSDQSQVPQVSAQRVRPERLSWAELVKRVFLTDILNCECGGRRKVLAMVFDPRSIERILRHAGLPYLPPERAPPRGVARALPFSDW